MNHGVMELLCITMSAWLCLPQSPVGGPTVQLCVRLCARQDTTPDRWHTCAHCSPGQAKQRKTQKQAAGSPPNWMHKLLQASTQCPAQGVLVAGGRTSTQGPAWGLLSAGCRTSPTWRCRAHRRPPNQCPWRQGSQPFCAPAQCPSQCFPCTRNTVSDAHFCLSRQG